MTVLKNDRELFEALLRGEKVEKVRHSGFGDILYLEKDMLINAEGKPANIYRITPADLYQIVREEDDE